MGTVDPVQTPMQAIEVTARFAPDGKITPLHFGWRGSQYAVESTGRRWQTDDGCHILVMANGGQMFELLFVPQNGCWYLAQSASTHQAV